MDVNDVALSGASEQQPVTQITVDGEAKLSVTEAARALAGARQKQKDQPQPSGPRAEGAAPHEVAQESTPAQAGNDAGELLAPPGETERADPAASELPPIDPPRSWTKEDKDPLHEPPSRYATANCGARAVTGGRLQPSSAGSRREEQGPRGRTLEGGTGKAAIRRRPAQGPPCLDPVERHDHGCSQQYVSDLSGDRKP